MKIKKAKVKSQNKRESRASLIRRPAVSLLLPFAFFLLTCSVSAQTLERDETIRVDTDLVDLNVSVFSRNRSRVIGELQQNDFAVFEDGVPQETSFFASASTPFDLVLLLDLSGSTADKLSLVRKSAARFVDATRPTDRVAVVTFSNHIGVISPLTSNREEIKKRLKKISKPEGGTNFWDALSYVLEKTFTSTDASVPIESPRRRAVVVMTDGVDNALPDVPGDGSVKSFDQLLETIKHSDAIVLPIYLDTEIEMIKERRGFASAYEIARGQLAQIAEESGSILYRARKLDDLKGIYEQVIRDLGTVYSIGYRPSKAERDGAWRNVSVRLVGRPELLARTKRGYYAK